MLSRNQCMHQGENIFCLFIHLKKIIYCVHFHNFPFPFPFPHLTSLIQSNTRNIVVRLLWIQVWNTEKTGKVRCQNCFDSSMKTKTCCKNAYIYKWKNISQLKMKKYDVQCESLQRYALIVKPAMTSTVILFSVCFYLVTVYCLFVVCHSVWMMRMMNTTRQPQQIHKSNWWMVT